MNQELNVMIVPIECVACPVPHTAVQISLNDFTFAMSAEAAKRLADQIYTGVLKAEEIEKTRGYQL